MINRSVLKQWSWLVTLGCVSALVFSACQSTDEHPSKSEHPTQEHPQQSQPAK